MSKKNTTLSALNERSREVFRLIVESYLETGAPVGSKTLSKLMVSPLSPASVRSVMADLEDAGLLESPHVSAGRLPSEKGMRLFVDGLLEIGALNESEKNAIEAKCVETGGSLDALLNRASEMLSGLSQYAGVISTPKKEEVLKHIEFVRLNPARALVVMVGADGGVENRLVDLPAGTMPSSLVEASNYLNDNLCGLTLSQAKGKIESQTQTYRRELNEAAAKLVERGVASWTGGADGGSLIVKGRANLLDDIQAIGDVAKIKKLFQALEMRENASKLLSLAQSGTGMQIFIGAQNELFSLAGMTMITAPYKNSREEIVGALGVIGPVRMTYARIIPLVDYTADVVSKLIG